MTDRELAKVLRILAREIIASKGSITDALNATADEIELLADLEPRIPGFHEED